MLNEKGCRLKSIAQFFGHRVTTQKVSFFFFLHLGFPGSSDGKASAYNAGDWSLIPGWGRSPGEGDGNPLQYSCLENPMH